MSLAEARKRVASGKAKPSRNGTPTSVSDDDAAATLSPLNPFSPPPWPAELASEAYHGLAGRFTRIIEPASESDPVGILTQFLIGVGSVIGRTAFAAVEGDKHFTNEYVVLVGRSAKGRKGTSWGRVREVLSRAQEQYASERVTTGLSSAEGLIWAVRDPIEKQEKVSQRGQPPRYETVIADPGIEDKRLLVVEPEFANVLKQTERQGNTLSACLRQGWETGNLRSLVKNSPTKATGAHISIIGHITDEELKRYLSATETANGFANRFMWFSVKRSKLLPDGGWPDRSSLADVECELAEVLKFAAELGEVPRSAEAHELWREVYPVLSGDRHGLAGSLCGRAEAHVLRLSVIYAVLDCSPEVRREHLTAALAVWEYAEESIQCIFGDNTGNPVADDILNLLRSTKYELSRTEIREMVGKNLPSDRMSSALGLLMSLGLAVFTRKETSGRTAEMWTATPRKGGTNG